MGSLKRLSTSAVSLGTGGLIGKDELYGTGPKTNYGQMSLIDEYQMPVWQELNKQAAAGLKGQNTISENPYDAGRTAFTDAESAYYRNMGVDIDPTSGNYMGYTGPSAPTMSYWNSMQPQFDNLWQDTMNKTNAAYAASPAFTGSSRSKAISRSNMDFNAMRQKALQDTMYGDFQQRYLPGSQGYMTQSGRFADQNLANKMQRWTTEGGVRDASGQMIRNMGVTNPYYQLAQMSLNKGAKENIVTQTPGTEGLLSAGLNSFVGGAGQAAGAKLGGKIG